MQKIIYILLILFVNNIYCQNTQDESNTRYIDFELPSISTYVVKLSNIVGKKLVILNFFATWCPYCNQEFLYLKKIYEKYRDKNLEIISISIKEPYKIVQKFAEKNELNHIILIDSSGNTAKKYNIRKVPTNFIIDLNGNIIFAGYFLPNEEFIIQNLSKEKQKEVKQQRNKKKKN